MQKKIALEESAVFFSPLQYKGRMSTIKDNDEISERGL